MKKVQAQGRPKSPQGKSKSPPQTQSKSPQGKAPQSKAPVQPPAKSPAPVKAPTQTKVPAPRPAFNAESYVKPGLSITDIEEIKKGFDLFDTDQGGSVDTKELHAAMISLGFDSKNALIFQMISDLDADGSGQLEFDEWLYLMTNKVSDKSSRDRIDKVFTLYDDEKTGYLSVKNLRRVANDLGLDISEQELQEMITRADTDHDGLVSADEFYVILTRPIKE